MRRRTLKALRQSIGKWRRNAEARTPREYTTGYGDCPLCTLFIGDGCEGCPVREATGESYCRGTPYGSASSLWTKWAIKPDSERRRVHAQRAARDEVKFLESLLPEEDMEHDAVARDSPGLGETPRWSLPIGRPGGGSGQPS